MWSLRHTLLQALTTVFISESQETKIRRRLDCRFNLTIKFLPVRLSPIRAGVGALPGPLWEGSAVRQVGSRGSVFPPVPDAAAPPCWRLQDAFLDQVPFE